MHEMTNKADQQSGLNVRSLKMQRLIVCLDTIKCLTYVRFLRHPITLRPSSLAISISKRSISHPSRFAYVIILYEFVILSSRWCGSVDKRDKTWEKNKSRKLMSNPYRNVW